MGSRMPPGSRARDPAARSLARPGSRQRIQLRDAGQAPSGCPPPRAPASRWRRRLVINPNGSSIVRRSFSASPSKVVAWAVSPRVQYASPSPYRMRASFCCSLFSRVNSSARSKRSIARSTFPVMGIDTPLRCTEAWCECPIDPASIEFGDHRIEVLRRSRDSRLPRSASTRGFPEPAVAPGDFRSASYVAISACHLAALPAGHEHSRRARRDSSRRRARSRALKRRFVAERDQYLLRFVRGFLGTRILRGLVDAQSRSARPLARSRHVPRFATAPRRETLLGVLCVRQALLQIGELPVIEPGADQAPPGGQRRISLR